MGGQTLISPLVLVMILMNYIYNNKTLKGHRNAFTPINYYLAFDNRQ